MVSTDREWLRPVDSVSVGRTNLPLGAVGHPLVASPLPSKMLFVRVRWGKSRFNDPVLVDACLELFFEQRFSFA
jgi:hypothetical protein